MLGEGLAPTPASHRTVGTYRHFAIEPLGDGVWAVIHRMDPARPDAWAIANAGIVDLGDRTLLFDTLTTTVAADELRVAAQALTGRLPGIVVYSHAHNDHTWGGSRFPEALFMSSAAGRAEMLEYGMPEADGFREVAEARLAFWNAAAGNDDLLVRHDEPFFRPYWAGIAATLPSLVLRYPDVGFHDRLEIHGSARHVELVAVDRAHGAGDLFMTVPDARVAFCGDLLFIGCHPYLGDGDVDGLRIALTRLEATGAERFVPGHGPVGAASDLRVMASYVADVERVAQRTDGDAAIPEAYRAWAFAQFFPPNVEFCASGGHQPAGPADQPAAAPDQPAG